MASRILAVVVDVFEMYLTITNKFLQFIVESAQVGSFLGLLKTLFISQRSNMKLLKDVFSAAY